MIMTSTSGVLNANATRLVWYRFRINFDAVKIRRKIIIFRLTLKILIMLIQRAIGSRKWIKNSIDYNAHSLPSFLRKC